MQKSFLRGVTFKKKIRKKYLITADTNSLIFFTYSSSISVNFLISVNCLIPSKLNEAVPRPLNSLSILNTHRETNRCLAIRIVSLSMKSSFVLMFAYPGAVGSPRSMKSYLANDLLDTRVRMSTFGENTQTLRYSATRNSSLPALIGTRYATRLLMIFLISLMALGEK